MSDLSLVLATEEDQNLDPEHDLRPVLDRMHGHGSSQVFQMLADGSMKVSESSSKGSSPLHICRAALLYTVDQGDEFNPGWKQVRTPDFQGGMLGNFPAWRAHLPNIPTAAQNLNNPFTTFLWNAQKIVQGRTGPAKSILGALGLVALPSSGVIHNRGSEFVYLWSSDKQIFKVEVEGIVLYYTAPLPQFKNVCVDIPSNTLFKINLLTGETTTDGKLPDLSELGDPVDPDEENETDEDGKEEASETDEDE